MLHFIGCFIGPAIWRCVFAEIFAIVTEISHAFAISCHDFSTVSYSACISNAVCYHCFNTVDIFVVFVQVYSIGPTFVERVMCQIVEQVAEEVCRLFQCVTKFSASSAIQVFNFVLGIL